uniref:Uncharacterized protein LOC111121193 isoform X2 n=1 Tax=Crassostrea virginica TaxID=6565 RepID=A0A8B8CS81_CRAVI|nr:uncharacterized protein LOC111121193 isoform X2 [Crassostrea virginica]
METRNVSSENKPPEDDKAQEMYVTFSAEQHELNTEDQQPIRNRESLTKSQKKRRKFIPLRYHSRIFKISSKKKRKHQETHTTNHESYERKETSHLPAEDYQLSINSSGSSTYAICKFSKESGKSNASCDTYHEIDESRIGEETRGRCNTISSIGTCLESYPPRRTGRENINTSGDGQQITDLHNRISHEREDFEKRKRFSKRYMYICSVVLVVAIISVGVAYLLSTNNVNDKLESTVQDGVKKLPSKEFMKQVVSNVTDVEYLEHVFSNISIMGIEKVQTEMDLLSRELTDLPNALNGTSQADLDLLYMMNEVKVGLANQTKELNQLIATLPKKSDIPDKEYIKHLVTNITNEQMKDAVDVIKKEIPNKDYIKQVVTDITKEEMKKIVDLLRKDIPDKEYLEFVVANKTKEEVKNSMSDVKKDIYNLTEVIKKHLYKFINGTRCKASCSGLEDGNYQSCHTCEGFISCTGGIPTSMSCQPSHPNQTVFWDDFEKRCNYVSYTCDTKYLLLP